MSHFDPREPGPTGSEPVVPGFPSGSARAGPLARPAELPKPCPTGQRVLALLRSGSIKHDRLVRVLESDEPLSAQLLKLVAASQPSFAARIENIGAALSGLGVEPMAHAAIAFSVLAANRGEGHGSFDPGRYWSRALARGLACHAVARATEVSHPLDAFSLGLLCESGRLALAGSHALDEEPLAGDTSSWSERSTDLEHHLRAIDHLEITRALLHRWGLPADFPLAVASARELGGHLWRGPVRTLDELLRAGEGLAACATSAGGAPRDEARQLGERIGLAPTALSDLCARVASSWREWCRFLSIQAVADDGTSLEYCTSIERSPVVGTRALRVLAVDDDPTSLRLLERHLTRAGHEVTIARDGNEALHIATEQAPQLVVADWKMPGLDGIELCRALRRNPEGRKIYFLLLTGHGEVENVVNAFDSGVDDYVEKPFNPDVLLARIKAGLRIIDLQDQVERDKRTQRKQVAELQLLTRKLRLAAFTDVLTGLPNRRYAMKRLAQAWDASVEKQSPLSIIMIDIDEFKLVNDEHGHDVGDVVLRETGTLLRSILREKEDVCRLGGEEFLVICEGHGIDEGRRVAERLREAVANHQVAMGKGFGAVTLSLGVAERTPWMQTSEHLLKAADEAVYGAKDEGRNQVRLAEERPRQQAESA